VVALGLRDPVLQAGVVRGGEVILARGLEVDIARDLARRLGVPRVRFVYVQSSSRLLAAKGPWDISIAAIRPLKSAAAVADLSEPYLGTDQAVVLRRGLPRPSSLADLRHRITCALRGSDGARAIVASLGSAAKPMLVASDPRLLELVQTGACDAAVVDADTVGRFVAGRGALLGPVSARIEAGGGYVVAVTRGGPVAVADVNRVLARMRADGTLHRLTRRWLGIDPARLRPLG
jgi:cystine transport system substrate-binding protein